MYFCKHKLQAQKRDNNILQIFDKTMHLSRALHQLESPNIFHAIVTLGKLDCEIIFGKCLFSLLK